MGPGRGGGLRGPVGTGCCCSCCCRCCCCSCCCCNCSRALRSANSVGSSPSNMSIAPAFCIGALAEAVAAAGRLGIASSPGLLPGGRFDDDDEEEPAGGGTLGGGIRFAAAGASTAGRCAVCCCNTELGGGTLGGGLIAPSGEAPTAEGGGPGGRCTGIVPGVPSWAEMKQEQQINRILEKRELAQRQINEAGAGTYEVGGRAEAVQAAAALAFSAANSLLSLTLSRRQYQDSNPTLSTAVSARSSKSAHYASVRRCAESRRVAYTTQTNPSYVDRNY
jgi:hypothetical protein